MPTAHGSPDPFWRDLALADYIATSPKVPCQRLVRHVHSARLCLRQRLCLSISFHEEASRSYKEREGRTSATADPVTSSHAAMAFLRAYHAEFKSAWLNILNDLFAHAALAQNGHTCLWMFI